MIFNTLKDKCEYYRSLCDTRLLPGVPVIVMVDGKNFSRLVRNKFKRPFDDWFIETMDGAARHVCMNVQNCICAFVQSDEISFIINDTPETDSPWSGRVCKLGSIIPATVTAYFNRMMFLSMAGDPDRQDSLLSDIGKMPDYVFDSKVWNVPNMDDAVAWLLYRQIDCVRNSKQQFCQTYIPHKELVGKSADEQVRICTERTGMDWNGLDDGKKLGRIITKKTETLMNHDLNEYTRSVWKVTSMDLRNMECRQELKNILANGERHDQERP